MKGSKSRNSGKNTRILAGACLVGGIAVAFPQVSHANVVIDVGLAGTATSTPVTGPSSNDGIAPITYTPTQVTVPYAPGETYDAADTSDSGTIWNSIEGTNVNGTTNTASSILFEQNLPLVNSVGAPTGVELNVSALEGSGKMDFLHVNHNVGRTGTDGFGPNPATSTYGASLVGDGYSNSSSDQLVMGTNWITNSTSDGSSFEFTGLTPGASFNLYVYGAGTATGSGGAFTLAAGNGGATASTNSVAANLNMDVFDSTGINPTPEKGLSWNLLAGHVDGNGDITVNIESSVATVKSGINGFQLDESVPEPATLGLLGMGAMGLLARRRTKNKA